MEVGTDAIISCIVHGISQQLDNVKWTLSEVVISNTADHTIDAGTFDDINHSQTTTLTVKASVNTDDSIYKCVITSDEWVVTDDERSVILDVFCKS